MHARSTLRHVVRIVGLSLMIGLFAPLGWADEPSTAPYGRALLVDFEALQARLDDPTLRILDVRPRDQYEAAHIPGAVWVDFRALYELAKGSEGLRDAQSWAEPLAVLGLKPGMTTLITGDNRQRDAARLWWLLTYLGADRVGLVDGGTSAWIADGRPVSEENVEVEPVPLAIRIRRERFADRDDVRAALNDGSTQIVDARSLDEYDGTLVRSQRGGHVPTACRIEWSDLVDEAGRFRSPEALRTLMAEAGLTDSDRNAISYCQGGGRASVDAFVLERLGYRTRNYYRGWGDWGNAEDTPIETDPSR